MNTTKEHHMKSIILNQADMSVIRLALYHLTRTDPVHRSAATRTVETIADVDSCILFTEQPRLLDANQEQISHTEAEATRRALRDAEEVVEHSESLRKAAVLHGRESIDYRHSGADLYVGLTALRGSLRELDATMGVIDATVYDCDDDRIAEDGEPA